MSRARSADGHDPGALARRQRYRLEQHRAAARALPHPDRALHRGDMPAELADNPSIHRQFVHDNVLVRVGENSNQNGYRWRTDRACYQWVQRHLQTIPPGPCDHTGVRNVGDGRYACGRDHCDSRFGRAVAEQRLANDYVRPCIERVAPKACVRFVGDRP